jgi:hypothetical protein
MELAATSSSAPEPRAVVLVEGMSDQAAVETLARRRGLDLAAERVAVRPIGGAHAIGRVLASLAAEAPAVALAGLYDDAEEPHVRRALARTGLGSHLSRSEMERLGFHVCIADLEDELIRALGTPAVARIIEERGELRSFRTFQNQPAQHGRSVAQQLRRFMGTRSGRKIECAALMVAALDPGRVPRPLDAVLAHAVGR